MHSVVERLVKSAPRRTLALTLGLTSVLLPALLLATLPAPGMAQERGSASARPLVTGLPDFTPIVELAGPAVVNIRTTEKARRTGANGGLPFDPNDPRFEFFRRFFPPGFPGNPPGSEGEGNGAEEPGANRPRGVGSGFIISADGYILSNHHVVEGADEVLVTMPDKREFKATIVGSDQRTDVALLKVDAKGLPTLRLGNPDQLRVGEWVVAIGSPFGLESTVTAGIVSAKSRETGDYLPFIQTDVAVNPGNSGGPLLNLRGEVVGINSQIYSRTGGFMGISFAIPINEAEAVMGQLKAKGRVVRGRIGVAIDEVSREVAEGLGLARAEGALVRNVEKGGPAEKAGVVPGDIILKFAGKPVAKVSDLPRIVGATAPGTKAEMEVWRQGSVRRLSVTVMELEPSEKPKAKAPEEPSNKALTKTWIGLGLRALSKAEREELGVEGGVFVEEVRGAARRDGLTRGDVVLAVNTRRVASPEELVARLDGLNRKQPVILLVWRSGSVAYIAVRPE